ncbi:HAD-IIA family hydrolase [Gordonia aquimaris]|uniref:HAD-IIA family hydrolase n=1 Tax=Gordonia aquimaris TaxID=2984863 RepID=A0A9X3D5Y8_9ACTN|nr:HAD-IIA family hydrolase [Gordonia aquimaris]MCX2964366.1 HAD-IIA family hydrolase [Gordonia aquimaris]
MSDRDRTPRRDAGQRRDGGDRRDGGARRDGAPRREAAQDRYGRQGASRRDGGNRGSARSDRGTRGTGSAGRPDEPALPEDVAASDLDSEVRRDLLTLDKTNAENVARHLVMVTRLLADDPAAALLHARAARRRAGRVGLVRETLGIAAYSAGEWQEAVSELRAARRITGNPGLLPLIADAERGLGRPSRAIEIARSDDGQALTGEDRTEMRIVESGARIDLGEADKAVVTLQNEDLSPGRAGTPVARLYYAYASALLAADRADDAVTWFMNAAAADVEDVTDAELRLVALAEGDPGDQPDVQTVKEPSDSDRVGGGEVEREAVVSRQGDLMTPESHAGELGETVVTNESAAAEPDVAADMRVAAAAGPVDQPATEGVSEPSGSQPAADSLVARYDALLLDLDGTVYAGHRALPGARETLGEIDTARFFVTNNASRRPAEVVDHLTDLGFEATSGQVVTSAQSAARLLAEHLAPGSRALVIGTDGLAQEVREVGIAVTRSAADRPAAVIQGHSPQTGWAELSEAALAIDAGALWIACNTDATLPSERGKLVGNGSMVAAVANATGKQPLVAGKPAAPLMADAIARSRATRPLVVGDRLDTDIEGAHAVGLDSVLVLTGVSSATDLLNAPPEQRPTYVVGNLTDLFAAADTVRIGAHDGWDVAINGTVVTVRSTGRGEPRSVLPALAWAVWSAADEGALDLSELSVTSPDSDVLSVLEAVGVKAVR